MRPGRVPWRGVAQEGSAQLVIALPVLAWQVFRPGRGGMAMDRVIIGVDPHKLSVTIEARDNREILRATGQFAADGHAIVMVSLREKGLREVSSDPELMVLRMLCDRRDELSRARVQALNRM